MKITHLQDKHCIQLIIAVQHSNSQVLKSLPLDSSLPLNRIWKASVQITGEILCFSDSAHNKPLDAISGAFICELKVRSKRQWGRTYQMQRSCCLSKDCSDTVSKSANAYADPYDCFSMFTGITYNQSYKYTTHTLFSSSTAIARGFRKPGRSKGGKRKNIWKLFSVSYIGTPFLLREIFQRQLFLIETYRCQIPKREFSNKTSKKS